MTSDFQILTNGLRTFTSDRRYKLLHAPGGSEWTLELVQVAQRDEGGYQCQVRECPDSKSNNKMPLGLLKLFRFAPLVAL